MVRREHRVIEFLELMRPYQYTKNLFIFLPAFFAFKLTNLFIFKRALLAFIAFSLVASAVYIFNDWVDRDEDRLHAVKKYRPIASGRIKGGALWVLAFFLLVFGTAIMASVSIKAAAILIFYLLLNVAYSLRLKHIAIMDVTVISLGLVLRLLVGSAVTGVELSHWIIVMTFLLALFLSLAKRRDDVLIFVKTAQRPRKAVDGYNLKFLDGAMTMSATIVVLAYALWSLSPEVTERFGHRELYQTSLFVVLGVLRYMQIVFVKEKSGDPSMVLMKDPFIQVVLFGWIGSFVLILYV